MVLIVCQAGGAPPEIGSDLSRPGSRVYEVTQEQVREIIDQAEKPNTGESRARRTLDGAQLNPLLNHGLTQKLGNKTKSEELSILACRYIDRKLTVDQSGAIINGFPKRSAETGA